jgi:protein SCO1
MSLNILTVMTRRSTMLGLGLIAVVVSVSVWARTELPTQTLPYYGSPALTAEWTATAHRTSEFSLLTQTGERLTNADLAGRVHVVSFIYTRCGLVCPRLVKSLTRVQAEIADPRLWLVSFSVTPEADSPEVLAAFGRERGIDAGRWKLVTGDKRAIYSLARDSYFASDERLRASSADPDAFLHTEKLILVDASGQIRGVYNGTQPFDVEHLMQDVRVLLAQRTDGAGL